MKAIVKWQGGLAFEGQTDSGHSIVMDAAPEVGGENKGARPMEMVLLGLGGCSSIDVVMMLNKSQPDQVKDCQVEITAERADSVPKVFTQIHMHFKVYGTDLNPKKVERAVNLSAEKYCSVSKMLEATVQMTHDFEIIEA
ncbi:MAG: OsmC family protein [Gammaproteobacteria bacterium]|nr:OsmC family protein [Gammaproteobacteria bacterium]MBD3775864.1 OsmC family protein [Thiotrichales bacterium]